MSEQYSSQQLNQALRTISHLDRAVGEAIGQEYIMETEAGDVMIDQFVIKAMRGGVRGLFSELEERGLTAEARKVIDDNPLAYW